MNTRIIAPDTLDYLATSPQCVDNQFVPEALFKRIADGKTTLKKIVDRILEEHGGDPFGGKANEDADFLLRTQRREYNRALLYSKQIVVNRAAFWNTPSLIVSALTEDVNSLAELIKKSAIVPYLYKEHSFDEPPRNFDHSFGERAMKRLVDALATEEINCVRLSPEDGKNNLQTTALSTRFRTEITKWRAFEERENIRMISQMLLPEEIGEEVENLLDSKILEIAKRVDELSETQAVGREHLYQEFIVKPNTLVSHGIYRSDPLTFEVKKWIDSVYTANLPNALNILTFTPEGFPTAYDLGMTWTLGAKKKEQYTGADLFEEVVDRTSNEATWQAWNAFQQNATLVIPDPDKLSHNDILEIRDFTSWKQMMDTLEMFLKPISEDGVFNYSYLAQTMWEAFAQFNRVLETWYLEKSGIDRDKVATKYAVGIGKILQLGEWMIGLLYDQTGTPVVPILPKKGVQPPPLDKDNLKFGIEAGLFFVTKAGIDWQRSHLVQNMGDELKVNVDEVRRMIRQIIDLFPEVRERLRTYIDDAPVLKPGQTAETE